VYGSGRFPKELAKSASEACEWQKKTFNLTIMFGGLDIPGGQGSVRGLRSTPAVTWAVISITKGTPFRASGYNAVSLSGFGGAHHTFQLGLDVLVRRSNIFNAIKLFHHLRTLPASTAAECY
jgi:hypothetical protein